MKIAHLELDGDFVGSIRNIPPRHFTQFFELLRQEQLMKTRSETTLEGFLAIKHKVQLLDNLENLFVKDFRKQ
jgi:hypothetical protein